MPNYLIFLLAAENQLKYCHSCRRQLDANKTRDAVAFLARETLYFIGPELLALKKSE